MYPLEFALILTTAVDGAPGPDGKGARWGEISEAPKAEDGRIIDAEFGKVADSNGEAVFDASKEGISDPGGR